MVPCKLHYDMIMTLLMDENICTASFKIWIIVSSVDAGNDEIMKRLETKIILQNTTFCIKYI